MDNNIYWIKIILTQKIIPKILKFYGKNQTIQMQRIRYITKSAILQLRFNDIIFDAILCGVIESVRT